MSEPTAKQRELAEKVVDSLWPLVSNPSLVDALRVRKVYEANCATLIAEYDAEQLRQQIAFTVFLQHWQDDEWIEGMTPERIEYYRSKWTKDFLPHLNLSHRGDCTKEPIACIRCEVEGVFKATDLIINTLLK